MLIIGTLFEFSILLFIGLVWTQEFQKPHFQVDHEAGKLDITALKDSADITFENDNLDVLLKPGDTKNPLILVHQAHKSKTKDDIPDTAAASAKHNITIKNGTSATNDKKVSTIAEDDITSIHEGDIDSLTRKVGDEALNKLQNNKFKRKKNNNSKVLDNDSLLSNTNASTQVSNITWKGRLNHTSEEHATNSHVLKKLDELKNLMAQNFQKTEQSSENNDESGHNKLTRRFGSVSTTPSTHDEYLDAANAIIKKVEKQQGGVASNVAKKDIDDTDYVAKAQDILNKYRDLENNKKNNNGVIDEGLSETNTMDKYDITALSSGNNSLDSNVAIHKASKVLNATQSGKNISVKLSPVKSQKVSYELNEAKSDPAKLLKNTNGKLTILNENATQTDAMEQNDADSESKNKMEDVANKTISPSNKTLNAISASNNTPKETKNDTIVSLEVDAKATNTNNAKNMHWDNATTSDTLEKAYASIDAETPVVKNVTATEKSLTNNTVQQKDEKQEEVYASIDNNLTRNVTAIELENKTSTATINKTSDEEKDWTKYVYHEKNDAPKHHHLKKLVAWAPAKSEDNHHTAQSLHEKEKARNMKLKALRHKLHRPVKTKKSKGNGAKSTRKATVKQRDSLRKHDENTKCKKKENCQKKSEEMKSQNKTESNQQNTTDDTDVKNEAKLENQETLADEKDTQAALEHAKILANDVARELNQTDLKTTIEHQDVEWKNESALVSNNKNTRVDINKTPAAENESQDGELKWNDDKNSEKKETNLTAVEKQKLDKDWTFSEAAKATPEQSVKTDAENATIAKGIQGANKTTAAESEQTDISNRKNQTTISDLQSSVPTSTNSNSTLNTNNTMTSAENTQSEQTESSQNEADSGSSKQHMKEFEFPSLDEKEAQSLLSEEKISSENISTSNETKEVQLEDNVGKDSKGIVNGVHTFLGGNEIVEEQYGADRKYNEREYNEELRNFAGKTSADEFRTTSTAYNGGKQSVTDKVEVKNYKPEDLTSMISIEKQEEPKKQPGNRNQQKEEAKHQPAQKIYPKKKKKNAWKKNTKQNTRLKKIEKKQEEPVEQKTMKTDLFTLSKKERADASEMLKTLDEQSAKLENASNAATAWMKPLEKQMNAEEGSPEKQNEQKAPVVSQIYLVPQGTAQDYTNQLINTDSQDTSMQAASKQQGNIVTQNNTELQGNIAFTQVNVAPQANLVLPAEEFSHLKVTETSEDVFPQASKEKNESLTFSETVPANKNQEFSFQKVIPPAVTSNHLDLSKPVTDLASFPAEIRKKLKEKNIEAPTPVINTKTPNTELTSEAKVKASEMNLMTSAKKVHSFANSKENTKMLNDSESQVTKPKSESKKVQKVEKNHSQPKITKEKVRNNKKIEGHAIEKEVQEEHTKKKPPKKNIKNGKPEFQEMKNEKAFTSNEEKAASSRTKEVENINGKPDNPEKEKPDILEKEKTKKENGDAEEKEKNTEVEKIHGDESEKVNNDTLKSNSKKGPSHPEGNNYITSETNRMADSNMDSKANLNIDKKGSENQTDDSTNALTNDVSKAMEELEALMKEKTAEVNQNANEIESDLEDVPQQTDKAKVKDIVSVEHQTAESVLRELNRESKQSSVNFIDPKHLKPLEDDPIKALALFRRNTTESNDDDDVDETGQNKVDVVSKSDKTTSAKHEELIPSEKNIENILQEGNSFKHAEELKLNDAKGADNRKKEHAVEKILKKYMKASAFLKKKLNQLKNGESKHGDETDDIRQQNNEGRENNISAEFYNKDNKNKDTSLLPSNENDNKSEVSKDNSGEEGKETAKEDTQKTYGNNKIENSKAHEKQENAEHQTENPPGRKDKQSESIKETSAESYHANTDEPTTSSNNNDGSESSVSNKTEAINIDSGIKGQNVKNDRGASENEVNEVNKEIDKMSDEINAIEKEKKIEEEKEKTKEGSLSWKEDGMNEDNGEASSHKIEAFIQNQNESVSGNQNDDEHSKESLFSVEQNEKIPTSAVNHQTSDKNDEQSGEQQAADENEKTNQNGHKEKSEGIEQSKENATFESFISSSDQKEDQKSNSDEQTTGQKELSTAKYSKQNGDDNDASNGDSENKNSKSTNSSQDQKSSTDTKFSAETTDKEQQATSATSKYDHHKKSEKNGLTHGHKENNPQQTKNENSASNVNTENTETSQRSNDKNVTDVSTARDEEKQAFQMLQTTDKEKENTDQNEYQGTSNNKTGEADSSKLQQLSRETSNSAIDKQSKDVDSSTEGKHQDVTTSEKGKSTDSKIADQNKNKKLKEGENETSKEQEAGEHEISKTLEDGEHEKNNELLEAEPEKLKGLTKVEHEKNEEPKKGEHKINKMLKEGEDERSKKQQSRKETSKNISDGEQLMDQDRKLYQYKLKEAKDKEREELEKSIQETQKLMWNEEQKEKMGVKEEKSLNKSEIGTAYEDENKSDAKESNILDDIVNKQGQGEQIEQKLIAQMINQGKIENPDKPNAIMNEIKKDFEKQSAANEEMKEYSQKERDEAEKALQDMDKLAQTDDYVGNKPTAKMTNLEPLKGSKEEKQEDVNSEGFKDMSTEEAKQKLESFEKQAAEEKEHLQTNVNNGFALAKQAGHYNDAVPNQPTEAIIPQAFAKPAAESGTKVENKQSEVSKQVEETSDAKISGDANQAKQIASEEKLNESKENDNTPTESAAEAKSNASEPKESASEAKQNASEAKVDESKEYGNASNENAGETKSNDIESKGNASDETKGNASESKENANESSSSKESASENSKKGPSREADTKGSEISSAKESSQEIIMNAIENSSAKESSEHTKISEDASKEFSGHTKTSEDASKETSEADAKSGHTESAEKTEKISAQTSSSKPTEKEEKSNDGSVKTEEISKLTEPSDFSANPDTPKVDILSNKTENDTLLEAQKTLEEATNSLLNTSVVHTVNSVAHMQQEFLPKTTTTVDPYSTFKRSSILKLRLRKKKSGVGG